MAEWSGAGPQYGLVWEDRREPVEEQLEGYRPVLIREEDSLAGAPGRTEHLLIRGDNLAGLTCLVETGRESVKCIYIDPPYNTGSRTFSYGDRRSRRRDQFPHSAWLAFMAKRLRLAWELLSPEGIIAISIDDHELAHLTLLCHEIFGEENFVANLVVKSNPRGSQSGQLVAGLHEYLLVYARQKDKAAIVGHPLPLAMQEEYSLQDERGAHRLLGLRQRGGFWRAEDRPNLHYPFYVEEETGTIALTPGEGAWAEVWPIQPTTGAAGTWRWSREKAAESMDELVARKISRRSGEVWDIYQKDYLCRDGGIRRTKARSIWEERELNYQNSAGELKAIFGKSPFSYAKPVYLIRRILEMLDWKDGDVVLDFFAGSGTTGQAVLEQNAADGIARRFILCTDDENGICSQVCYPRLRTLLTGIRPDGTPYSPSWPDGLCYSRVDWEENV